MRRSRRKRHGLSAATRIAVGLALVAGVGGTMQALTASNTVTAKRAGDGSATVSGYTVTNPSYTLNATNPANIDAVTFTTSSAAATVRVRLVSSTSNWYSCTTSNSPTNTNWSCTTTSPQVTVAAADELRVVAAE